MNDTRMNDQMSETVDRLEGLLADIEVDYLKMVEARDNILGGKTTRDEVFVAVNAGATNMLIMRGMCEKYLEMIAVLNGGKTKKVEIRQQENLAKKPKAQLSLVAKRGLSARP